MQERLLLEARAKIPQYSWVILVSSDVELKGSDAAVMSIQRLSTAATRTLADGSFSSDTILY